MLTPLPPKAVVHMGGGWGQRERCVHPPGPQRTRGKFGRQFWLSQKRLGTCGLICYWPLAGRGQGCCETHNGLCTRQPFTTKIIQLNGWDTGPQRNEAERKEQLTRTPTIHCRPSPFQGVPYLGRLWSGYHMDCAGFDSVSLWPLIESKSAFPPASVSIR